MNKKWKKRFTFSARLLISLSLCLSMINVIGVKSNDQINRGDRQIGLDEIHFKSVGQQIYKSYVNLTQSGHASFIELGGNEIFPCGTGTLKYKLLIDEGYKLGSVDSSVEKLTGKGKISDFISYSQNEKKSITITIKHANIGKHNHGSHVNSTLTINAKFNIVKDVESDMWKTVSYYKNDTTKFYSDTTGYQNNDIVSFGNIKPETISDLVFLGYTPDADLVQNTSNVIETYSNYLAIEKSILKTSYLIPNLYTGKDVALYAVYINKAVLSNKLSLGISFDYAEEGDVSLLPEDMLIKGFDAYADYEIAIQKIKGYVSVPNVVKGEFGITDKEVTVLYYLDENEDGIPDNRQEKHKVTVHFEYAKGEEGKKTLEDKVLSDLLPNESFEVIAEKINGYVARPSKVSGVIGTNDIEKTITYYLDRNGNEIPDSEETHYQVRVDYAYGDDEDGDLTLLPDAYENNSFIEGDAYAIQSPSIEGYVAVPVKVEGTISNQNIVETVMYYLDENDNGIPDIDEVRLQVDFIDYNGDFLKSMMVLPGMDALAPENPVRFGYTFIGWLGDFTNITADTNVFAMYSLIPITPEPEIPVGPETPESPIPTTPVTPPVTLFTPPAPAIPFVPAPAPVVPDLPLEEVTPNETPKADTPVEQVEDKKTPKAKLSASEWSLISLLAVVVTLLGIAYAVIRKFKDRNKILCLLMVVIAGTSIIAFILTNQLSGMMTMMNPSTIILFALAAVQGITIYLSKGKKEE